MSKIKFTMASDSAKKKIMSMSGRTAETGIVKGGHIAPSLANMPLTKSAQWAGGGNIQQSAPMFFSPFHTPQNFQIAAKRKEMYSWIYHPDTTILSEDFTYKKISKFQFAANACIHDTLTGGVIFEDLISEKILGSSGEFRQPKHLGERQCLNKTFYSFKAYGNYQDLKVSEQHMVYVLDGNELARFNKLGYGVKDREKRGINKGKIRKERKLSIIKKQAKDINKNDYLLMPIPKTQNNMSVGNDKAWMLGCILADGCVKQKNGYEVNITTHKNDKHVNDVFDIFNSFSGKTSIKRHTCDNAVRIVHSTKQMNEFCRQFIQGKYENKKMTKKAFDLLLQERLSLIAGYIDGDGCIQKNGKMDANNISEDMSVQLYNMAISCGISCSVVKNKTTKMGYSKDRQYYYTFSIPSSEVYKVAPYMRSGKVPADFIPKAKRNLRFFYEQDGVKYLAQPIQKIEKFQYTGIGWDLQVDPERAFVASGYVASNCRFYYETEPLVAAGVDFYSSFPLNGYKLICEDQKILRYYENQIRKLDLTKWMKYIAHEYFLLGDVFPHIEISCPLCGGSGKKKDGTVCNHAGGTVSRISVLNPDWIEVQENVLASQPVIALLPGEQLRMIVERRQPKQIYNKLPKALLQKILSGQPIHLSNRTTSHIKHNASPYGIYGTPMIRRLFTSLAYKTKLMTANWLVAERLILPTRIVKLGNDNRPATPQDIADVTSHLTAVANDPNLTLVTHHAFEYTFEGASGKIQQITAEMEYIQKEILAGLMLNAAILNSEGVSYSSAQIGVETLLRRLENWRNTLEEWVQEHIFLPIAIMQGFVDKEKSEELGQTHYIYPKLKFDDMNLRDNSNKLQFLAQLHDKKLISTQTLLQQIDMDYDHELERIREQTAQSGAAAGGAPGGDMMGGMGGGMPGGDMGALGGGAAGDLGAAGGMPADLGGAGAMPDMGAMGGSTPPVGDMGAPAGGESPVTAMIPPGLKITKRGGKKAVEKAMEQQASPPPTAVALTKLQGKTYKIIQGLNAPFKVFAQYKVPTKFSNQPYMIDFAMPQLKLAVQADGAKWHENPMAKKKDQERDNNLSSYNWTVIRLKQSAIAKDPQKCAQLIKSQINRLIKARKNNKNSNIKTASSQILESHVFEDDIATIVQGNNG